MQNIVSEFIFAMLTVVVWAYLVREVSLGLAYPTMV